MSAPIRPVQPVSEPLQEAVARVVELDPIMSALERGERRLDRELISSLEAQLESLQALTLRLLLDLNAHVGLMRTEERDALWQLYKVLLALVVLLMVAGSLLVVSLVQEGRANRERRYLLEAQARELDAAVQQAEHASQAKSDFMAVMSHEVRTPLSGVVGVAELLAFEPMSRRGSQLLGTLNDSLDSLQAVINDVIDYTKYDRGALDLDARPYRPREFIDQLSRNYRLLGESRGIGFHVTVEGSVPVWLEGDTTRIGQVIMNLLNNAFKFTASGEVRLTLDRGSDDRLLLSVEDTGCGIPEQSRPQLFQPFTQADSTIARRFGGSGLGLAICERLVTAMQGEIGYESREGLGSRFWVRLPLRTPVSTPASGATGEVRAGTSAFPGVLAGRLLVVEDHPTNRELARAMLVKLGVQVDAVSDGQAALEALSAAQYDLVLMDMQMPGMDGLETTRRWRRMEGETASPLPVVALTANAMPDARQRCLTAGMQDVLCKPYTRNDLQRILHKWLVAKAEDPECNKQRSEASVVATSQRLAFPVDADTLQALLEALGRERLLGLVCKFTERLDADCTLLQRSLERGDRRRLKEVSHTLKGASSSMGCSLLSLAAAELEREANEADTAVLAVQVEQAIRLAEETKLAFGELGYMAEVSNADPVVPFRTLE